ncbi:LysR family transcriptional regulator [uncultured Megasphaera sp.]|uniref:LysR family transcriptional regulator n=1 Tax=uncultured Megasphaera sp. TaxID=165188 RepID=UPI0026582D50|nr:LysR family transcriptional regulator [uncultured Megasphaera sp.]
MNIDHFIYFIETVKKQSFTKAADSLFISQSTISKAVRSLEKAYDTELVDRTAKKFKLTSAGEIFYHSAVKIVSNYQAETEVLSVLLNSRRGTLTLGIPPVTITIVHSILHQYQAMYPAIHLQVSELGAKTAYSLAKAGAVDISILIQPFVDTDFVQIPFLHSDVVCVVSPSHRLANYDTISFQQLSQESFYILNTTFMLHDAIIDACHKAGFSPHIVQESGQWDLLVESVCSSNGVTLLPRPIIEKFCTNKVVSIALCDPILPWVPTVAYHKEKFISAPMKLFLDMIEKIKERNEAQ